jgi:hypothetical protein
LRAHHGGIDHAGTAGQQTNKAQKCPSVHS